MSDVVDVPTFLTVQEAAVRLRISRTAAYVLARRWLETSGREGIPAVRIGRSVRVRGGVRAVGSRPALFRMIGGGRLLVGPGAGELIRRVGPTAWTVLQLAAACSDREVSGVSARRVAAELGVSKDTAARALRVLTGAGLLEPLPVGSRRWPIRAGRIPAPRPERRSCPRRERARDTVVDAVPSEHRQPAAPRRSRLNRGSNDDRSPAQHTEEVSRTCIIDARRGAWERRRVEHRGAGAGE